MQVFDKEDKKSDTLVSRDLSISSSDDSSTSPGKTQKPAFVIGIGASAGGLNSLEKFFRNMPDCTGLSFVVIQHLSPDYKSMMVELLSKHTKMAIKQAEDGMEVEPDKVYLIPPKVSLTIATLKLHLSSQSSQLHALHMPIDIFFRSLAEDMERRAIGIVLSGTGSDGTLGSRAIKEAGGMLMVQDPNSAQFDGMPNSAIHTGLADYVLPPEKMPGTLLKYVKHPLLAHENRTTPSSKEGDILAKILHLIQDETGLDFAYYKPSTVIRRIERRMGINQIEKLEYYLRYLEKNPGEIQVLYNELLIGVTRFFRDKEAFHIILQKVIPEIVAAHQSHPAKAPIRIWVAGCSSGEEVYSLAIFLSEYLEKHNINADIKIFATDIDQRAVDIAAIGKYPASIVSDLPIALLSKYFFSSNDYYQVVEKIRKMVIFARHNLLTDPPFNNLDLVTCRNLLIYLRNDIQQKVLSMFGFALKKDGFLFLGSSETVGNLNHLFAMFDNKWRIYRSKGKANLTDLPFMERDRSEKGSSLSLHATPRTLTNFEPDTVTQRIETHLLDFHVPPTAVLDQDLNLVHTIGDINDFLQFPKGRVSFNIFKLSDTNLSGLIANAIRKARQTQQAVRYKNVLLSRKGKKLSLTLLLEPFIDQKTKRRFFLLTFEGAEKASTAAQPTQEMQIGEGQELHIQELEHELQLTRENLQATIEELETSNEELQASNEELMSANEELQSTNEELQSVNEELYTLNSEYQNKIEELTALNNDIDNFLNSTHIGTIFLDQALRIRKFTPAVREQFPIMEYDVGRPITHFAANFDYPDLVKDLQAVLDSLLPHERHVRLTNGKTYQVRILPYRTSNNTIDGLILTFVDITRLVEMSRELSDKENLYHTLMEMAPHCIWLADSNGKIIYLNPTRYGHNDPAPGDSLGDIWLQAIHPDDAQRVREAWQHALQQDAVFRSEGRFLSKAGNYRHRRLLGISIKNEAGKTTHWAGINTDITDFKQTEQELANREALFRRLYELAPIGMALNTLNGRFVMANQTLLNLLGYAENELTKLSLQDLTALEDTEEEVLPFNGLQTTGKYGPCYKECLHRDGHRVSMIFNGILYTHTDGSQYLWSFMQKCSPDN